MLWRESWTFGTPLRDLLGISSDSTPSSISTSIANWETSAIGEATNLASELTGTLPDAAAPKDQHIESCINGRFLSETSDSGGIKSTRGNEGGWAGVNNRPVVTADMNYYDRDCWKVTLPDAAPVPSKGEEACEGHGYGKASCAEVGCCQYAECSIGDGSGECFSAVGTAQCTPVEFSSHVETCP